MLAYFDDNGVIPEFELSKTTQEIAYDFAVNYKPNPKQEKEPMKLSQAFPSNYITAADLNGHDVTVTISKVAMERLGQGREAEDKLLINFVGKEKGLICNKTNAKTIAKLWGDDTDSWIGKPITIGPREVEFQGDMVWAIRVSLKTPQQAPVATTHGILGKPANRPAAEPERSHAAEQAIEEGDVEVPF